ncbi:MAG: phosphatase PAP2 family protein [Sulfolobales archaeon]
MDLQLTLMILLSCLGDELIYLILSSMLVMLRRNLGIKVAPVLFFSIYLNQVLKYWLNVQRPINELNSTETLPLIIRHLVEGEGPSMPSGHTQVSATFWTSLTLNTYSKASFIVMTVLPILVGYSRVALGMHSSSDVITALLIGYSIPLAAYVVSNKYRIEYGTYGSSLILIMLVVSSAILKYPKLPLISGLITSIFIAKYLTTDLSSGFAKRLETSLLSLTVLGLGYATLFFNSFDYLSNPISEFLISLTAGLIAYVLIPVKTGIFRLRGFSSP